MIIESSYRYVNEKIEEASSLFNELVVSGTIDSSMNLIFVIIGTYKLENDGCRKFERYLRDKLIEKFNIKFIDMNYFRLPIEKITEYLVFMYDVHEKYNEEVLNVKK